MTHSVRRAALMIAFVAVAGAFAQDPQLEPPKTPAEFYDAVEYELNTGKYDTAAYYLKDFIGSNPTDKDYVELERKKGMAAFLRLRNVPQWSADAKADAESRQLAEQVIEKATAALKAELGDPERIKKLIEQLRASPEERAFALRELQRSSAPATPILIEMMRADPATNAPLVLGVLPVLDRQSVAPLLAALDIKDNNLRVGLLRALSERPDLRQLTQRAETNPLPELDFYANTRDTDVSDLARSAALAALVKARGMGPTVQPQAKVELTKAAERLWRHETRFINPQSVPIWRLDGDQLKLYPVTAGQAEEYLGLRYARMALLLDPAYEPAQLVFLSLAAEKAMERSGLDKPLAETAPDVNQILSTVYIGALNKTLERALAEKRTPLALAVVRAMAPRADRTSAVVLANAINYPDRRVALAAADALMRLPPAGLHHAHSRVVEVLRRALAAEADVPLPMAKRILIGHFDPAAGEAIADAVRAAGYEAIVMRTGKEMMRRLKQAADIDGIILDHELPYPTLEDNLASMRYDIHVGQLPLRVNYTPTYAGTASYLSPTLRPVSYAVPPEMKATTNLRTEARLNRLIESYKQCAVVAAPWSAGLVKREFGDTTLVSQPAGTPTLSTEERKAQSKMAIEWLKRLATGEVPGYDVRPAAREILLATNSDDLAKPAIEAAARLPGREPQSQLVNILLNANRAPELRKLAAESLVRHAQRHGNALTREQLQGLLSLLPSIAEPDLRSKVAIAIGILQASPRQSGERLQRYLPLPPVSAPKAPAVPPELSQAKVG